jgi:tRNA(Ile2) C34 agmatinyltransferase TiaS
LTTSQINKREINTKLIYKYRGYASIIMRPLHENENINDHVKFVKDRIKKTAFIRRRKKDRLKLF